MQTLVGAQPADQRIFSIYWGTYRKRLDFNADQRADFAVAIEERTSSLPPLIAPSEVSTAAVLPPGATYTYSYELDGYCPGVGWCWAGPTGPSAGNQPNFGDYNGDGKSATGCGRRTRSTRSPGCRPPARRAPAGSRPMCRT